MDEVDRFDDFAAGIRDGIEAEVAHVRPGNDLEPKLIMECPDGTLTFAALGNLFESEQTKDYLGDVVMPSLIRAAEASRAAWLTFAWQALPGTETENAALQKWREEHGGSMEGGPGVFEAAQVWVGDFTGQFAIWTTEVIRDDEGRPSLGEWQLTGPKVAWFGECYGGRMIDSAMSALVGNPTPTEIRAAIKQMAQDEGLRELFEQASEILGFEPDADGEPTDEQKQAFLRDPRCAELRDRIKERGTELLGHPSPVVRREASADA